MIKWCWMCAFCFSERECKACQKNWTHLQTKCYKVNQEKMITWRQAQQDCQSKNSQLLLLNKVPKVRIVLRFIYFFGDFYKITLGSLWVYSTVDFLFFNHSFWIFLLLSIENYLCWTVLDWPQCWEWKMEVDQWEYSVGSVRNVHFLRLELAVLFLLLKKSFFILLRSKPLVDGHCAAFSFKNNAWKSVDCNGKSYWICEKEPLSL